MPRLLDSHVRRTPGGFTPTRRKSTTRCGFFTYAAEIKQAAEAALLRRWRARIVK